MVKSAVENGFRALEEESQEVQVLVGTDPDSYRRDYQPRLAVTAFHDAGRFGHSRDFSYLFSSNEGESEDYIHGLAVLSSLILLFFCIWGLYLIIFKCLGPKRVGRFLCGEPYESRGNNATFGRIVFLVSAVLVIVFAILLAKQSVHQVDETSTVFQTAATDVINITGALNKVLDQIQVTVLLALPIRTKLLNLLEEQICDDILGGTTMIPDGLDETTLEFDDDFVETIGTAPSVQDVLQILDSTMDELRSIDESVLEEIVAVDWAVTDLAKLAMDVDDTVDTVDTRTKTVSRIMFAFYFPTALLISALVLGWREIYNERFYRFISYVVLPVFTLILFAGFVCGALSAAALEVNADFCSGGTTDSPEGAIQRVLWQYDAFDGVSHDTFIFYMSQCRSGQNGPFDFIADFRTTLGETMTSVGDILEKTDLLPTLPVGCEIDVDTIRTRVNEIQDAMNSLLSKTDDALELLSCSDIVPIYTSLAYDGICDSAVGAMSGAFVYLVALSFFGMTMITFRAAYYPIDSYHLQQKKLLEEKEAQEQQKRHNSRQDSLMDESTDIQGDSVTLDASVRVEDLSQGDLLYSSGNPLSISPQMLVDDELHHYEDTVPLEGLPEDETLDIDDTEKSSSMCFSGSPNHSNITVESMEMNSDLCEYLARNQDSAPSLAVDGESEGVMDIENDSVESSNGTNSGYGDF